MKVAIVGAGFTPAEADQLRRAMATFKLTGGVSHFYDKLVNGMIAREYPKDFAERTLQADRGVRQLWLSREPCGELRQDRLCQLLDQASSSRYAAVAEVTAADGTVTLHRLETVNGYTFTPMAAAEAARRVLAGEMRPGFQIPAGLFGSGFAETIADTSISSIPN